MRPEGGVVIIGGMADEASGPGSERPAQAPAESGESTESAPSSSEPAAEEARRPANEAPEDEGSPADDLAKGLDLMMRAARKAVRRIDTSRVEQVGRRAIEGLEGLDRRRVGELGRKAVKNLDPRRIEEIAEEAGRELINVVERVADRVETVIAGEEPRASGAARPASAAGDAGSRADATEGEAKPGGADPTDEGDGEPPPRVRIRED